MTVTVPTDVLAGAVGQVDAGRSPSLSAYVSDALARQVAADAESDAYLTLLDRLDEELGPPSAEDYVWARRVLGR